MSDVTIKPLEWKPQGASFLADTPMGEYAAEYYSERDGIGWSAVLGDAAHLGDFASVVEAKSACEADYEKRVLSCLQLPA